MIFKALFIATGVSNTCLGVMMLDSSIVKMAMLFQGYPIFQYLWWP